jgi:hypothetical protein
MHKKANLDNIGFNFYDLLEYIKVYNPTKPKLYNDANSFLILNIVDDLLKINSFLSEEDNKNLINRIDFFHKRFLKLNDLKNTIIISLNTDIPLIEHKDILHKASMFKSLSMYSKNPLEPLLKLLIQDSEYKKIISDLISALCRGDFNDVKMFIYDLQNLNEQLIKEE